MKLLSFGEVLWDVYSDAKYIGGAPLNFAAHYIKNGLEAYMVSAIGNDELGKATLDSLKKWNIHCDYVAVVNDKVTGKCLVELDERQVPTYNLLSDVAYDYIPVPKLQESFDVLYFGTLALRSDYNYKTIQHMIKDYHFTEVFVDVNIRPPHYSKESIQFAFNHATLIKISEEELDVVLEAIEITKKASYSDTVKRISEKYPNIKIIIITCGENGSFVYEKQTEANYSCEAKKVQVASTVGAGDSFSATFLAQYLQGKTIPECLDLATQVSAFVVSQAGAIPEYTLDEIMQ